MKVIPCGYILCVITYIHHKFTSTIQYDIISLINEQYDANGPVERRETSSLLMSTCPITITYSETFNVKNVKIDVYKKVIGDVVAHLKPQKFTVLSYS